ncbi:MAG: CHRD domain-containing protein [Phycisphaerales bacterium]|nr:CHRD domain-containing protein [Phycisphaerales bacterium]
MQTPTMLAVLALTTPFVSSVANAEIITINNIVLDGFQTVPPTGSLATGFATVILDTDTRDITITGSFEGLENDVFIGHLHGPANFGQSSSNILLPLFIEGDFMSSGTFHAQERLSPFQMNVVLDSRSYINIHSFAYPDGEIRGQVVIPAPSAFAILGMGCFGATRRRRS